MNGNDVLGLSDDRSGRSVVLRVGDHCWRVEAEAVVEVVPWPQLTAVPTAPDALLGIFLYGNEIVPVFSVNSLLSGEEDRRSLAVVAIVSSNWRRERVRFGIAADGAGEDAGGRAVEALDLATVVQMARGSRERAAGVQQSRLSFGDFDLT